MQPLEAAEAQALKTDYCEGPQPLRGSVRYTSPKGIGYNHGYSTLEFFLTPYRICNKSVLPFVDLRGHVFDNGRFAANAGLGLRCLSKKRIWGFNAYYDYRDAKRQHYNQIALGLEGLGKIWDYRINGYLPVGWKQSPRYDTQFNSFQSNNLFIQYSYDFALKTVNAEVGAHINSLKKVPIYIAAGPYYMTGKGVTTWGGCLRASIEFFSRFIRLEGNVAYDHFFKWTGQGQVSINIPFGGKCFVKKKPNQSCAQTTYLSYRAIQPVERKEIIPVGTQTRRALAINPATGQPFKFVFVNNTSRSSGTYESPYHSLAQAQSHSDPNNIIYVFPGNGTAQGMNSGITLKAKQKLWGSGISHSIDTSQGKVVIPAQSSTFPIITNTDADTLGNAVTLSTNNTISGFIITAPLNDAIYGADCRSLKVSSCAIKNSAQYAVEVVSSGAASISLTNIQFLNNENGVFLTLNDASNIVCRGNTFSGQTSISSMPVIITANSNRFVATFKNNAFRSNTTGSIQFNLNEAVRADVRLINNVMANNGSGALGGGLGSNLVFLSTGTTNDVAITLKRNQFLGNTANTLYLHTDGAFSTLNVTALSNTFSNNGGAALVLATPVDTLTVRAQNNTLSNLNDNGIAIISSGLTTTGNIRLSNNIIRDIGNASNGIAINQNFTNLNLTIQNNAINRCAGTGILSYSPAGIESLNLNVLGNTIQNCANESSNAASGIDFEQFKNFTATIANNTLSDNTGLGVFIGSTLDSPTACLTLTGNSSSSDYTVQNPGDGTFYLTPCGVTSVNVGTINQDGVIDLVQSCSNRTPCPSVE